MASVSAVVTLAYVPAVEEALQCGICLDQLKRPVIDECGHTFDEACLEGLAKKAAEKLDRSPNRVRLPKSNRYKES